MIGTPFQHQGRRPGHGLDCAGVVVCAAKAVGVLMHDCTNYRRIPHRRLLRDGFNRDLQSVNRHVMPGDVLLFWMQRPALEIHCGIATPAGFVHVEQDDRVREEVLTLNWRKQLAAVYTLEGAA